MTTSEVPATMRKRAAHLTTAGLSDALDRLGIVGQVAGVRPLGPSYSVCGPAFTVRYRAVEALGETVGDYIDDVPPGSVVVIDNQGRTGLHRMGRHPHRGRPQPRSRRNRDRRRVP